jgi:hypothetical protein
MDTCVILPCAGEGSRLGLPFPKELAPLGESRLVIDSCLDMIRNSSLSIRIILLENGRREQTARYIRRKLPGISLAMIRQDPSADSMPAAVQALKPWLANVNIILLPDVIYEPYGSPLAEIASHTEASGCCFGAAKMHPDDLRRLGALKTTPDARVLAYEDKPHLPGGYDSAWGILGFSGDSRGMEMLYQVQHSTRRSVSVVTEPVLGSPVVWLEGFRDCGTWESYRAEFSAQYLRYR